MRSLPLERKPFYFEVRMGGYPVRVLVAVALTRAQIDKRLSGYGCTPETCMSDWHWQGPESGTSGRATIFPCNNAVLWLRVSRLESQHLAFIAHEVFHIVYGALDNLGIELTDASEEAYAYAISDLTRRVLEGLVKHRRRR